MTIKIKNKGLDEIFAILFMFLIYNPISYTRINSLLIMSPGVIWFILACAMKPGVMGRCISDKLFIVSLIYPALLMLYSIRSDVQFEKRCLIEPILVLIFLFYIKTRDKDAVKTVIRFLMAYLVIISVNTILALHYDPYISRNMAGSSDKYGNFITGGYGTVYSLVLLVPILFSFYLGNMPVLKTMSRKRRMSLLIICLLFVFFVIRSQYTTGIFILAFGLAAEFIWHKKEKRITIGIIAVMLIAVILIQTDILPRLLVDLSTLFPDGIARNRIHQLAEVLENLRKGYISSKSSVGSLQRVDLALLTFDTIKHNWLFGVGNLDLELRGGHSTFLDAIAKFGVICGGIYIFTKIYVMIGIMNQYLKETRAKYKIIVVLYILLSVTNTTNDSMIPATMIILIPFLCYTYEHTMGLSCDKSVESAGCLSAVNIGR